MRWAGGIVGSTTELVDRYVAVWNEPDAELRGKIIRELWAEDGAQILQPPREMAEEASKLGFSPILRARGHDELDVRVTRAHEEFVGGGQFLFRRRDKGTRLLDVVKFAWEMVSASSGDVAGAGVEILLLDVNGRIRLDYQFIEG